METDWDKHAKALLHGYLGGQAGAKAVARLVSGKSCPSGKLAETMPLRLSDTPCFIRYPGAERTSEYREGIFVGYRYYDMASKAVKYPFGFGLSYTSFEYGGLELAPDGVSFTIKNAGSVPGAEIAQVYVAAPKSGVFCPEKELRGFARVALAPGETKRVFVRLPERAYQYWNGRLPADDTRSSSALRRAISACAASLKSRATVRPTLTPAPFSRRTAMRRCSRCRMRASPRCSAARYRRICGTGMSRWSLIPRSCRALSDPASEDCFIAH